MEYFYSGFVYNDLGKKARFDGIASKMTTGAVEALNAVRKKLAKDSNCDETDIHFTAFNLVAS